MSSYEIGGCLSFETHHSIKSISQQEMGGLHFHRYVCMQKNRHLMQIVHCKQEVSTAMDSCQKMKLNTYYSKIECIQLQILTFLTYNLHEMSIKKQMCLLWLGYCSFYTFGTQLLKSYGVGSMKHKQKCSRNPFFYC